MKKLSHVLLFLFSTQLAHFETPAIAAESEMTLKQSQSLTMALLKVRKQIHFLGRFRDRGDSAHLFNAFERVLNERLPNGPHRITELEGLPEGLKITTRLHQNSKETVIYATLTKETEPAIQSADHSKVSSQVSMAETLGLTINDVTSQDSADGARFISITQARGVTDDFNGQVEGGIRFKRFTLSVFSRQILFGGVNNRTLNQNGVAITAKLAKIGGFDLSVRLEAAQALDSKIVVSEGEMRMSRQNALNAQVRFEISRTFGMSGVSVGGGIKFLAFGAQGLDQVPLTVAFLRVSKAFRNKAGREVASIGLLATHEVGHKKDGAMISLVASIKF